METEYENIKKLILTHEADNITIGLEIAKSLGLYKKLYNEFKPILNYENWFDLNGANMFASFNDTEFTNICNHFTNCWCLSIFCAKNINFDYLNNLQDLMQLEIVDSTIQNFYYNFQRLYTISFNSVVFDGFTSDIENLKNLKTIQIENCKNIKIHDNITKLELKSLSLNNCGLKEIPNFVFDLENLTNLNLWNNLITEIPKEIGNLKKLTSLTLSTNKLETLPIEICELENLTSLVLLGNKLINLPIEIGNLKYLKYLNIPKISAKNLKQFQKMLPNTKITIIQH